MPTNPLDILVQQRSLVSRSVEMDSGLIVHYRHDLPGELEMSAGFSHHMLTFFLSDNPAQATQIDDFGTYNGSMKTGDFYLCPAGAFGTTRWQSVDKTLHIVVEPRFLNKVAENSGYGLANNVELMPVLKQRDTTLEQLVRLFYTEIDDSDIGKTLYRQSLSSLLGVHLLRHYCKTQPQKRLPTGGLSRTALNSALDYIHARLGDRNLSLDAIAAEAGFSRCYFIEQFKQSVGITPYRYVTHQRIEKAKQLLQEQTKSLVEIAMECGFSSQSHLSKQFKKHVGTSPKAYRNSF
ncbi:MAG: AraC family transcriptional regulator [Cyanobacteria bacterium P01_G01_bin.4]